MAFPKKLLDTYFSTFDYPFVRHHIDSYDQFLSQDLPAIIQSHNPFLLLKQLLHQKEGIYKYRVEIFIGGLHGTDIEIGTPTLTLQKTQEIRVLFPNEARLRNLTYASTVYAKVLARVTIASDSPTGQPTVLEHEYAKMPIFQIPILLHSRYCILHGKPAPFLQEAGECHRDQGGYFVIEGSEKVLVTRQEQAFNTLYVTPKKNDPKVSTSANITCLSPITRQVKVVLFNWMRKTNTLQVSIPFVRLPVPIFVLFRAMGVQSDKDILRLIFPDLESGEAQLMIPYLLPSIAEAVPFLDTFSAVEFIRVMTKGFSKYHVYDILFNKLFVHITDTHGGSRVHFLADCVRRILRVQLGLETKTDRDDTRNQRCLTSGLLIRMLFNGVYPSWKKAVRLSIDKTYSYNKATYSDQNFMKLFREGNVEELFNLKMLTEGIMRGFKGKWVTGGSGGGGALGHSDEKTGVLQALSRISYMDFMSHCRRVSLNFDTGMKLTGPRQLHPSQFGFFCTNETPGGASIGIAKNLSMMTLISISADPAPLAAMLVKRGWVLPCSEMNYDMLEVCIPVYINDGILGYTLKPFEVTQVLKYMKWTGCLPAMCSIGFSIKTRRVFIYLDEGRPCRPLVHLEEKTQAYPKEALDAVTSWRDIVMGSYPATKAHGISTATVLDPFAEIPGTLSLEKYAALLKPMCGQIEYVDPYEQNEILLVSFAEEIGKDTSHVELHPSTILSVVNGMIPFANYNQSPRNQLSCSQSKQGLSMYATNFQNRYDNSANILCYGEAPLVRTYMYDKLGGGSMPYGHNLIMAIMSFQGYNQDDGIIFNEDAFQRGQFRSINYRSYTTYEEVDKLAQTTSTIAHPSKVPRWTSLRPGLDYTKLDDRGIITEGSVVDENTVLVGKYIQDKKGNIQDSSLTCQVWTSGIVESVVITVNPQGFSMVKVRITQDRIPEFGDKFSTRHGQKGTIGMVYRAQDMPRTADGLVPDMIVNPHCIPSRMTIAQLMEMLFGWVCYKSSTIGDATTFTSDSSSHEFMGKILEEQYGMERGGNMILYDGASGKQIETSIFLGPVFTMRLKHMVEDKWNARAEGRREQKTHQPTGGRGAQGGLRIGEMERDALISHGVSGFLKESLMERSDKAQIRICNGCGTVPIFNAKQSLFVCPLCDGPPTFIGATTNTMEILPTMERSSATTSIVEMPYATKLLGDELQTYLNMGMRFLTAKGVTHLEANALILPVGGMVQEALDKPLPQAPIVDTRVPKYEAEPKAVVDAEEDLFALGRISEESVVDAAEEAEAEAEAEVNPNTGAMTGPPVSQYPTYNYGNSPSMQPMVMQQQPMVMQQQPMVMQQPMQPMVMQQQPMVMQQPMQPMQPMQQQQPMVPALQGVPQVIQSGGYQEIHPAPFTDSFNTITIDTRPINGGSAERDTRRKIRHGPSQGQSEAPHPSAKITVRKVG